MMKFVFSFLCCFFCKPTNILAQSFFKGTKSLIVWNSGDIQPKNSKLKNGGLLLVKFDGFLVNVNIVFGSTGYAVENFEETDEWEKMEITEYDFDKDDKNELVIAYGDKSQTNFKIRIYTITRSGATAIGNIDNGKSPCYFDSNKIVLPSGLAGSTSEYTLTKGKFTKTK